MNTYSFLVQSVTIVVEADDEDEAYYEVRSSLDDIAIDYTDPILEV